MREHLFIMSFILAFFADKIKIATVPRNTIRTLKRKKR